MICCVNCFDNPFIIERIQENGERDNSKYCESEDIPTICVEELGYYIRECLSKAYRNAQTDIIPFPVYEESDELYSIEDILIY